MIRAPSGVLFVLLLAACGEVVATPAGPADPAAEVRPDLLVVEPAVAAPGDVVALTFPEESSRGILFVLEERIGDSWAHRYNLTSDGPGTGWELAWYLPDANVAIEDIGVGGPGPDRVPIPETAEPGDYRICTGNAGDEFCALIEIAVRSGAPGWSAPAGQSSAGR